jgi:hypothetical protein
MRLGMSLFIQDRPGLDSWCFAIQLQSNIS